MDGSRTITRVATVLAAVFAGTSVGLYLSLKSARAQRLEPRAGASIHSVEEVPATSPLRTASEAEASLRDAPPASDPASPKPGAEDAPRDTSITGALPALRDAPDRPDAVRAAMATLIEDMASYAGLDQHESDRFFNYMVESMGRAQEARAQCSATPGCDRTKVMSEHQRAARSEVERILPLEKLQRLDYRDELENVNRYRRDLSPDADLPDEVASELAKALSEERYRFVGNDETREQFNRRLYNRAQSLLDPEQLATFRDGLGRHFSRDF